MNMQVLEAEIGRSRLMLEFEPPAGLLERYSKEQKCSLKESSVAFKECTKFLLLCSLSTEPCVPSTVLDEMWHTFLMFSRSYREFCEGLGGFIDHQPKEWVSAEPYRRTLERAKEIFGPLNPTYWPQKNVGAECDGGNCGQACTHCNS